MDAFRILPCLTLGTEHNVETRMNEQPGLNRTSDTR